MRIHGKGHPNVTAKHSTTIAFTRDSEITKSGDCFVAVACDWAVVPGFLAALRAAPKVIITITCAGHREIITGSGHPGLTLSDKDLVIRKSSFVDGRTLCIHADKAACDLDSALVAALRAGGPVTIDIAV